MTAPRWCEWEVEFDTEPDVPPNLEVDLPEPIGVLLGPDGSRLCEVRRPCGFRRSAS